MSDDAIFVMLSATFPKHLRDVARKYMKNDYVQISIGRLGSTIKHIHQMVSVSPTSTPYASLLTQITDHLGRQQPKIQSTRRSLGSNTSLSHHHLRQFAETS